MFECGRALGREGRGAGWPVHSHIARSPSPPLPPPLPLSLPPPRPPHPQVIASLIGVMDVLVLGFSLVLIFALFGFVNFRGCDTDQYVGVGCGWAGGLTTANHSRQHTANTAAAA